MKEAPCSLPWHVLGARLSASVSIPGSWQGEVVMLCYELLRQGNIRIPHLCVVQFIIDCMLPSVLSTHNCERMRAPISSDEMCSLVAWGCLQVCATCETLKWLGRIRIVKAYLAFDEALLPSCGSFPNHLHATAGQSRKQVNGLDENMSILEPLAHGACGVKTRLG